MQQTVYLDILIFLNTIINFYILFITGLMSHSRIVRWRILLGGILGGVLSCLVLVPEMNELISLSIKALTSAGIVYISFEPSEKGKFFRRFIYFLTVNFIFAGAVLFFCFAFKTPLIYYNNSNFYFDISAPILLIIATLTYILLTITVKRSSKQLSIQKYYQIEICKENERVKCTALSDTGNSLREMFSETPVVVADISSVKSLLSSSFYCFFADEEAFSKSDMIPPEDIRLIPYSDISGSGFLKAFKCDEIRIIDKNKAFQLKNGYVAVYNGKLSNGNYNAIINPEIFDVAKEVA